MEQVFPRVAATVQRTEVRKGTDVRNRAWPWLTNHGDPFNIDDAVLLHLRKSLQWLAKNNVALFRQYASTIAANHTRLSDICCFAHGRTIPRSSQMNSPVPCCGSGTPEHRLWKLVRRRGGHRESAISRLALNAISPLCSAALLERLEAAIIGYCDEYEKKTPRWRGYAELLVLRSLDRARISRKAVLRIEELERKFPNVTDAIVAEDKTSLVKCVGSPIRPETVELMTDDQWISAMRKYDGSTDRFRGGPVELSRLLADSARKDRGRFASLATRIPQDVDPMYFSAVLDGLCSRYTNLKKEEKEADQKESM